MCALKLGASAEVYELNSNKIISNSNERLVQISRLLEEIEKD